MVRQVPPGGVIVEVSNKEEGYLIASVGDAKKVYLRLRRATVATT